MNGSEVAEWSKALLVREKINQKQQISGLTLGLGNDLKSLKLKILNVKKVDLRGFLNL